MRLKSIAWLVMFLLLLPPSALSAFAVPQQNSASAAAPAAKSSAATTSGVSRSEIAAAKAAGKVWVNLDSGIYHKSGRWYGKTKHGKFLTEDEAKKAGYKPSQRD